MIEPLTWSREQVAAALSLSPRAFGDRRRRLEAAGFPKPLPGLRWRYDPLAVTAWLARLRQDIPADSDAALQAELDRRAGLLASPAGHA